MTHYNPYIPPPPPAETRLVATFNVEDTSSDILIYTSQNYADRDIESMEIDGVELGSVVNTYRFDTVGEHTVKYVLINPTSIGYEAFSGCHSLTSIVIPNSVTSIDSSAFNNCSGLTSIDIPNSVTSIGDMAFQYCSGLASIVIPSGLTIIGGGTFNYCSGLTSCTIGSGVTSIGDMAFQYCSGLTSIDIPDSVTSIGDSAFRNCTSLTSATIGSGVTSIGQGSFAGCHSLDSMTVEAITPPTLSSNAFINTNNFPIYVPSGSVDAYKAAEYWSDYASRIQAIS